MSTTYGTSKSVTIPSDGDTIDAVDVNVPIAAMWDEHDVLADLTALQAILVPTHGLIRYVRGYGHFVFVTSGTYSASTVASPWILTATDGTPGRWVYDGTAHAGEVITVRRIIACADACSRGSDDTAAATWDPSSFATQWAPTQDDSTSATARIEMYTDAGRMRFVTANAGSALAKHVLFPLNAYVIHEGTFVDVVLRLQGNAGHGALPANMPTLGIARYDPAANTWASLVAAGTTADTSASTAAYEALHTITATVNQNATIDREQYIYYAVVANEAGANALAQLALVSLRVRMTALRVSA